MKYNTDDGLIPDGTRTTAEIVGAIDKFTRSAGLPMVELAIRVYFKNKEYVIDDWLVDRQNDVPKIRAFCIATGLPFNGELDPDAIKGKVVGVEVGIRSDDYGDKNRVKRYFPVSDAAVRAAPSSEVERLDADIPF